MAGAASPPSALAAWTCPLTGQLFVEPVLYLAPNDGAAQIYERAALEQQLASLGITGDDRGRLVPVEAVRFAVEAAVARGDAPPPARDRKDRDEDATVGARGREQVSEAPRLRDRGGPAR